MHSKSAHTCTPCRSCAGKAAVNRLGSEVFALAREGTVLFRWKFVIVVAVLSHLVLTTVVKDRCWTAPREVAGVSRRRSRPRDLAARQRHFLTFLSLNLCMPTASRATNLVHESPQRGAIASELFFAVARSRYCVMALSAERRPTTTVGVLVLLTVAVLLVATPYSTRGVLLAEPDDPERQVPLSVSCLSRVRMRDRSRTRALCLSRVSSHLDVPGCARARSRSLASPSLDRCLSLSRERALSIFRSRSPARALSL